MTATADDIIQSLHQFDQKVDTMRMNLMNDPDTLGDKALKTIIPMVTGTVAGKLFKTIWDSQIISRRNARNATKTKGSGSTSQERAEDETAQQQGTIASIVFAVLSAAFAAVVSELSTRGSDALVSKRQSRRAGGR